MYESPIELIISDMQHKVRQEQDKQIYEAVQRVDVNVNKEELIKALNYDRQQYEKGYADGIKEFAERLKLKVDIDLCEAIECSDYLYNLPKLIDELVKEMVGE